MLSAAGEQVSAQQKTLAYTLPAVHFILGTRAGKALWGNFRKNAAVKSKTHGKVGGQRVDSGRHALRLLWWF